MPVGYRRTVIGHLEPQWRKVMNSFLKRSMLVLTICIVSGLVAIADTEKTRNVSITIPEKVTIKGTVLKPGTYKVRFDEQSGELTVKKDGKEVAKTAARLEKRTEKARQTAVVTQVKGDTKELVSIAIGGEDENIVLSQD